MAAFVKETEIVMRYLLCYPLLFVTTKLSHPAAPPHVAISHLLTWNWNQVTDIQFDFSLSEEQMARIAALAPAEAKRTTVDPGTIL